MSRVDLVVDCKSVLGESPIWCGRSKRLFWIDINGRTISAYEPAVQQMPCVPVPMPALVGTIVPRAGGNLLACLEEDVVPVNPDTRVVGLPLAAVPREHRACPARSSSRERGAFAPRFQPAAGCAAASVTKALRLSPRAAVPQAARECGSTTASATLKGGCGSERCTRRACPALRERVVACACACLLLSARLRVRTPPGGETPRRRRVGSTASPPQRRLSALRLSLNT